MRTQAELKAWFDMPGDPDKSRFEVLHLRAGAQSKIINSVYRRRLEFREDKQNPESDEMESVVVMDNDPDEEKVLTIIECVTSWENVFDENGAAMDCTDENKREFYLKLSAPDLDLFLNNLKKWRKILASQAKEQQETQRKNS